jgi:hypothetical protein
VHLVLLRLILALRNRDAKASTGTAYTEVCLTPVSMPGTQIRIFWRPSVNVPT